MATEIERKFLVVSDAWRTTQGVSLRQGYLCRSKERTVRVRIAGDHAYLTIKGASVGASRAEYEYEIPVDDADQLLQLCQKPLIEKIRHHHDIDGFIWEVDEFLGDNQGLVLAEIELESESQEFKRPAWIGREVTGDPRYYNANLVTQPFGSWKE